MNKRGWHWVVLGSCALFSSPCLAGLDEALKAINAETDTKSGSTVVASAVNGKPVNSLRTSGKEGQNTTRCSTWATKRAIPITPSSGIDRLTDRAKTEGNVVILLVMEASTRKDDAIQDYLVEGRKAIDHRDRVFVWVDQFCKRQPSKNVEDGIPALYTEVAIWRQTSEPNSCAEWIQNRKKTDPVSMATVGSNVLGWLTGRALKESEAAGELMADILVFNKDHQQNYDALRTWMDQYCASHPDASVFDGANILGPEILKRKAVPKVSKAP